MALELASKISALAEAPNCVYDALESILNTCDTPEKVQDRVVIAIKLSMCEFEATGIEYPYVCHDLGRIAQCTKQLESKSTWWTTFSGNYRNIPVICQEFKPQFESHRLISSFRGSIDLFEQYQQELKDSLTVFQEANLDVIDDWGAISTKLQNEMDLLLKSIQKGYEDTARERSEVEAVLSMYNVTFDSLLQNVLIANSSISGVHMQSTQLESQLNKFSETIDVIEDQQKNSVMFLKTEIQSSTSLLASESNKLHSILTSITPFALALRVFLKCLIPFTAILFLILGARVFYAPLKYFLSYKQNKRETEVEEKVNTQSGTTTVIPDLPFW